MASSLALNTSLWSGGFELDGELDELISGWECYVTVVTITYGLLLKCFGQVTFAPLDMIL